MTEFTPHQKLAQLANFIEDLPHRKFFMPTWASKDATEHSCGTAGCAAGWAVTLFGDEDFCLTKGMGRYWQPSYQYYDTDSAISRVFWGANAFAKFFDIPLEDANWITVHLYPTHPGDDKPSYIEEYYGVDWQSWNCSMEEDPQYYITPTMVAERIRKVLQRIDPDALKEPGQCPALERAER